MLDDLNITQNPTSEENSIPPSSHPAVAQGYGETRQEPTPPSHEASEGQSESAPLNTADSEPAEVPSDASEASEDDFQVKSNDIPLSDSTLTESENEPKTEEKQEENAPISEPVSELVEVSEPSADAPPPSETSDRHSEAKADKENDAVAEPVSEPVEAPEPQTAQIPVNEPFEEPETSPNEQAKPIREQSKTSLARELLITARNAIQFRKRKKLDRIMSLFLQKSKITNDEVEKFLHVSDATATRYLSQLEKEGKIKQSGKTGKGISYFKI